MRCTHAVFVTDVDVLSIFSRTNVDMNKDLMTVLSPAPKPLPRNILLLSEVTFMDLYIH